MSCGRRVKCGRRLARCCDRMLQQFRIAKSSLKRLYFVSSLMLSAYMLCRLGYDGIIIRKYVEINVGEVAVIAFSSMQCFHSPQNSLATFGRWINASTSGVMEKSFNLTTLCWCAPTLDFVSRNCFDEQRTSWPMKTDLCVDVQVSESHQFLKMRQVYVMTVFLTDCQLDCAAVPASCRALDASPVQLMLKASPEKILRRGSTDLVTDSRLSAARRELTARLVSNRFRLAQ